MWLYLFKKIFNVNQFFLFSFWCIIVLHLMGLFTPGWAKYHYRGMACLPFQKDWNWRMHDEIKQRNLKNEWRTEKYHLERKHSSLVAHWLLVPGDHGSNPSGGEKCSYFIFRRNPMIAVYLGINSWIHKMIDLWIMTTNFD